MANTECATTIIVISIGITPIGFIIKIVEVDTYTCTKEENALRPAQWRSDGTVDQLYLALRLAVAQELTPDAPLVLDDALVRFDDERLKAAVEILKAISRQKQVILFTCHGREKRV
jgi:uncharacterized protein YhaN